MRRLVWWGLPLAMLLIMGFYRPEGASSALPLAIAFTSETNGYLTPCGCSKPMVGGIPRRATYLKQLAREYELVKLENGDLTKAGGRQDELKAETLIDMLNAMGYDALNLGLYDFKLGMEYLRALQVQFKGTMLCGNVLEGGNPAFEAYTLLKRSHKGRPIQVLVVGMFSETHADALRQFNPALQVVPVNQQLDTLRPQIENLGDLRVLLLYGNQAEAERVAQAHPYFHLIVYANSGDGPAPPRRVGNATLVFAGNDAKYVGVATVGGEPMGVERAFATRLVEEFADDPAILQIKMGYLARVEAENLLAMVPKRPTPNGSAFAGSRACMPCHAEDYRIWQKTAHAKAMQTLVDVHHHNDPECVGCHVVGLEYEGGFVSLEKTPTLKDVGCESCHGTGRKHIEDPENNKMGKLGEAICMNCHVPAHSPNFNFETYWKKIEHGKR